MLQVLFAARLLRWTNHPRWISDAGVAPRCLRAFLQLPIAKRDRRARARASFTQKTKVVDERPSPWQHKTRDGSWGAEGQKGIDMVL